MGSFTSHRGLLIACVAILAITVAIGGCFGGGDSSGAVLKGYVTEIDTKNLDRFGAGLTASAPGVEGARVTLVGTGQVATTNRLGEFTFTNVSPGTYSVAVRKTGWASATAYNVRVDSNRTNEVALRMVKPGGSVPVAAGTPPTVSVGCSPSPVRDIGYINVSASGTSGINGILLFIDDFYVELFHTGDGATYTWNTSSGKSVADNGEHTVTAMAMDMNGNIGCRSIAVRVEHVGSPTVFPPETPTNVEAGAVTVHYSVFDLIYELEEKYKVSTSSSLADEILALAKSVQETESQIRPLAMPAGSEAVTSSIVTWKNSDTSVKGFKIYRDGVFIGESPAQSSSTRALLIQPRPPYPPKIGSYIDGSSKLTPNVPVSYRVSAYNDWGEGNKSSSSATTPLGALKGVSLHTSTIGPGSSVYLEWSRITDANLYVIAFVSELSGEVVAYSSTFDNEVQVNLGNLRAECGDNYHWYVLAIKSIPGTPLSWDPQTWTDQMSVSASELGYFEFPPQ